MGRAAEELCPPAVVDGLCSWCGQGPALLHAYRSRNIIMKKWVGERPDSGITFVDFDAMSLSGNAPPICSEENWHYQCFLTWPAHNNQVDTADSIPGCVWRWRGPFVELRFSLRSIQEYWMCDMHGARQPCGDRGTSLTHVLPLCTRLHCRTWTPTGSVTGTLLHTAVVTMRRSLTPLCGRA